MFNIPALLSQDADESEKYFLLLEEFIITPDFGKATQEEIQFFATVHIF